MFQREIALIYFFLGYEQEYFKAFIFIPNLETVLATCVDRFRCFKDLIGIIDCTEVFIKTPKSLEL